MSTSKTIVAAAATSAVVATVICLTLGPKTESPDPSRGVHDPRVDELLERWDALERRVDELQARGADTAPNREQVASKPPALSDEDIARIAALLQDRGLEEAPPRVDVVAAVRVLRDASVPDADKQALWKQLRTNGQIDAIVARFEELAAAAPGDSMTQTELAWAYQQRMLAATTGPERGPWGAKAAAQFERALEVDATNWDARFSLAQHTYWADMRGDAIRHFQTLVRQQSDRIAEPRHAAAYLWLGNILMDRGDVEESLQTWRDGLALFPADENLRERLDEFR